MTSQSPLSNTISLNTASISFALEEPLQKDEWIPAFAASLLPMPQALDLPEEKAENTNTPNIQQAARKPDVLVPLTFTTSIFKRRNLMRYIIGKM